VAKQRGLIYTFGSYRLGAHKPGGDIDVLCVGPQHCTREAHFFGSDTSCLETILRAHPDVKEVQPVPGAFIPVMRVDFDGIDLDIIFAPLPMAEMPDGIDWREDWMLRGVDERTANTLNGTRVTDAVLSLVPNRDGFHAALKLIKTWAENRGIYANKLGFLGGINCAILVAKICQWWPNAAAAKIVSRFFEMFSNWTWPRAVLLTRIDYSNTLGHKVWFHQGYHNPYWDVAPIITPVYPAFNSTHNVSLATREVMVEEFRRGKAVCDQIFGSECPDFGRLCEPFDFFSEFRKFLCVKISGKDAESFKRWQGWVVARLRLLVQSIQELMCVRPWPEELTPGPGEDEDGEEGPRCYLFLGVTKRKHPLFEWSPEPSKQVALTQPVESWIGKLYEFSDYVEGRIRNVSVSVNIVAAEKLPPWVAKARSRGGARGLAGSDTGLGREGALGVDGEGGDPNPRGGKRVKYLHGGGRGRGKENEGEDGSAAEEESGSGQGRVGEGPSAPATCRTGGRQTGTSGTQDAPILQSNLTGELQALGVTEADLGKSGG